MTRPTTGWSCSAASTPTRSTATRGSGTSARAPGRRWRRRRVRRSDGRSSAGPSPGATFNPTAGHGVTIFGGIGYPAGSFTVTDFNDIWDLRGTVWTDVTPAGGNPPGRGWTQLVWDPLLNRIVMFAGYRVGAPAQSYGDTWSFVNGGWSEIVPQASGPGFATVMAWRTTPRETRSSSSAGISRTSSSWTARRGRWRCGRTGRRRRTVT